MPVRRWPDLWDEHDLRCALGACDVTGAVTLAATVRVMDADWGAILGVRNDSGDYGYIILTKPDGTLTFYGASGVGVSGPSIAAHVGDWLLICVGKASGSATPRFSIQNLTDSGAMVHTNGAGPLGNAASVGGGGYVQIGQNLWDGSTEQDIQAAAIFPANLSDTDRESLALGLDRWDALDPAGMWVLDQANVSTPVTDRTGNGADQSYRVGTTVVSEDGPIPAVSLSPPNSGVWVNIGGVAVRTPLMLNVSGEAVEVPIQAAE